MTQLITWIGFFFISLFFLIKSSDYFTDSAEKLGLFLGIPNFIIGATIVSVGTSLPELVSSIIAVSNNSSEIVVGNVLGSNITNICLVLGISAIVGSNIQITYKLNRFNLMLLVGSAIILTATLYDSTFTLLEALLCIGCLILYISLTIIKELRSKVNSKNKEINFNYKNLIILIFSTLFIYFGAKYTIEAVINLSKILNIGKETIAASAIALGTSFPELMVSLSAARKGNPEMAIGNVIGSNIFNSFAVMGIPALIGSLVVPQGMLTFSLPLLLICAMLIATVLYFFIAFNKKITRWEGWLLLLFYFIFIGKLFKFI